MTEKKQPDDHHVESGHVESGHVESRHVESRPSSAGDLNELLSRLARQDLDAAGVDRLVMEIAPQGSELF